MDDIIVGVDESDTARVAAQEAAVLAQQTGRPLHLVMALKRAKTPMGKASYLVAALLCLTFMFSVARAHSPWGFFAAWLSI